MSDAPVPTTSTTIARLLARVEALEVHKAEQTATIAAYISLGGLGRLLIDGKAQNDFSQMVAGAILVALLALFFDQLLAFITRRVVSPGLTRRTLKSVTSASGVTVIPTAA